MERENYSTCIVPYLKVVSGFDSLKAKEMEKELINILKKSGCTESRYRRIKTDREGKHTLYHHEAELIFQFFQGKFGEAIEEEKDTRMKATLETWAPISALSIYWADQVINGQELKLV